MRAAVGLGNPGPLYASTRHNLGFWVLERLLSRGSWEHRSFPWGEVFQREEKLLLFPTTFMNLAGKAVAALSHLYSLRPEDLLLVHDDADLPLGEVRLRPGGGPGSHRGVQSVLGALGTEGVPRLRVGIGSPPSGMDLAQFVLSPPTPEEMEVLASACDFAAQLAAVFLEAGLQEALDTFSRWKAGRPV